MGELRQTDGNNLSAHVSGGTFLVQQRQRQGEVACLLRSSYIAPVLMHAHVVVAFAPPRRTDPGTPTQEDSRAGLRDLSALRIRVSARSRERPGAFPVAQHRPARMLGDELDQQDTSGQPPTCALMALHGSPVRARAGG